MCFEVVQEYAAPSSSCISTGSGSSTGAAAAVAVTAAAVGGGGSGKGEANMLGYVRLNLAEYVEVESANTGEGGEGEVVRRYLMQGSKINSTLKVRPYPTLTYPILPCPALPVMYHGDTNPHISDWNPHDTNRRRNKLHRVLNPTSSSLLPSFLASFLASFLPSLLPSLLPSFS